MICWELGPHADPLTGVDSFLELCEVCIYVCCCVGTFVGIVDELDLVGKEGGGRSVSAH